MSPKPSLLDLCTYKASADHQVPRHRLWVDEKVLNLGEVHPSVCVIVEAKVTSAPVFTKKLRIEEYILRNLTTHHLF